ncbi:AsnC family transcriptional regulator [Kocuria flava]|uniref:AsnC family transcriptional regulator n=1 Tax=Kocuria flava TaxID=446860 RepID=A0A0U2WXP4_9MICC|nr:Lrp/AsnC family transcriptional regulator [Kocuria flava]ALU41060.1 AsnC family transcriptional regulator [Kocuria flava]GEO93504.1 AsnC family transcriptional regulator [Kocuria flava]
MTNDRLDATDRRILAALDEDPRMTVLALAQRTGLARGTIHARLERFRAGDALRRHSTRVTPGALGYGMAASVAVELDQHQLEAAVAGLEAIPEVIEVFAPAGQTDLLCRVVARDPDDLYRVSEEIRLCPGILRTSTSMFLRTVIPYRIAPLMDRDPGPQARGGPGGR